MDLKDLGMSEHRINCISGNGNLKMNISRQRRTEGRLLRQRLWASGCSANIEGEEIFTQGLGWGRMGQLAGG